MLNWFLKDDSNYFGHGKDGIIYFLAIRKGEKKYLLAYSENDKKLEEEFETLDQLKESANRIYLDKYLPEIEKHFANFYTPLNKKCSE